MWRSDEQSRIESFEIGATDWADRLQRHTAAMIDRDRRELVDAFAGGTCRMLLRSGIMLVRMRQGYRLHADQQHK